jgi:hypothetical protein
MPLRSRTLLIAFIVSSLGVPFGSAQAGPLVDWLFGRRQSAPATPVGQPIPVGNGYAAGYGNYASASPNTYPNGYAANLGTYYDSRLPVIGPNGAGYPPPMPSGITAATMPSTMSYVPNYRSSSYRAPVTYYRPLLTTDPKTGAQVVVMAPCTSYEYLTQRAPTFGRSALFGSTSPPVVQPPSTATPTYTLPSGGIPLGYSAPNVATPYTTGYGNYEPYSAQQPPVGTYPSAPSTAPGTYPTAPQGTPAYGTPNGGSCGSYIPPRSVPGLIAPQAPAVSPPSYSQPGSPNPGYSAPAQPSYSPPSGVYPPSGGSGTNPADVPPSLPPTFPTSGLSPKVPTTSDSIASSDNRSDANLRPQLRSMVQQPRAGEQPTVSNQGTQERNQTMQPLPTLKPIPVPEGFERQPRWNPGLLSEEDMTAMHSMAPTASQDSAAQFSAHSKTIQWASFETAVPETAVPTVQDEDAHGLRPIIANPHAATEPSRQVRAVQKPAPATRHTGGWKATR